MQQKSVYLGAILSGMVLLSACDSSKQDQNSDEQTSIFQKDQADVLPYLNIKQQAAEIALPFCENKNCIELEVQTLNTQDAWLNSWIAKNQAMVIQDQIGLKQNMNLQQAVDAYVKKSDAWQAQLDQNKAYELAMYTRMAYQRNQYVLLQVGVDSKQEGTQVKERYYFFVADRKQQKALSVLDVIDAKQQTRMNTFVQQAYQDWLKTQSSDVQKAAPLKLYWGQADWFFDDQGLGLHYRTHEIVKDGTQLDIYLSKAQTQQVLKAEIYPSMF